MAITQEQFRVLVKAMKAVWSDPKFISDQDAFMTWYAMLNDLTYQQLSEAIKAYMQTEVFTPTIAGIRAKVQEIQPEGMTVQEAWGMVRSACTRSGYYYQDEFEKLPDEVKKAVGVAENLQAWSQVNTEEFDTVIYSQFIKQFNAVQKRQGFTQRLSEDISHRLQMNVPERIRIATQEEPKAEKQDFNPEISKKLENLYQRLQQ